MAIQETKPEKQDYTRSGNIQDREMRSTPPLSKEGEQYMKNKEADQKKEQEKLLKLQEKWNKRNKEGKDQEVSKEDLEIFKRVAAARKLYHEIREEVAGIDLGHENIEDYQDIRTQAFSEYMTLFNDLVGRIKREFN